MSLLRLCTVCAACLLLLVACDSEVEDEVIDRVVSPDGVVDAVLVRRNLGATTSYVYRVHIVPTGAEPEEGLERFIADHVSGLEIKWQQPQLLTISYGEARIFKFTNFWSSEKANNFKYVVELRLDPASKTVSLSIDDRKSD